MIQPEHNRPLLGSVAEYDEEALDDSSRRAYGGINGAIDSGTSNRINDESRPRVEPSPIHTNERNAWSDQ